MAVVTLFEEVNFGGASISIDSDTPRLSQIGDGWHGRVSSIQVHSGIWEFCTDKDFGGLGILLQAGKYCDVKKLNLVLNDTISSARVIIV
ncbi:hypothetical protein F7734_59855 [Scytonema sp. UIC 10036]|uniref:beta/gamma crystallin-related protein n=1 Tax=Scytonema sp. UIC 10036 TaxID=2304196 RepID=UPI0012DA81B9|nr:beta/gamma crystallin-related protein [Scytonema sp. UIC 10036]MUH01785.1 hypothetical protein [Scytonema sp. UIC 10036]